MGLNVSAPEGGGECIESGFGGGLDEKLLAGVSPTAGLQGVDRKEGKQTCGGACTSVVGGACGGSCLCIAQTAKTALVGAFVGICRSRLAISNRIRKGHVGGKRKRRSLEEWNKNILYRFP